MIMLQSISTLLLMVLFFSVIGLSFTPTSLVKKNITLIPALGLAAVLTIAYLISANFKIAGANAVGLTLIVTSICLLVRSKQIWQTLKYIPREQYISFAMLTVLPMATLLLPAEWMGFKYFFASVNYDFFYNSQDSWYLINHNVLEYDIKNDIITPLNWSANYSGRIAIGLLASFFAKFMSLHPLSFNSLLLNSIVILFSLSLGTLCLTFFNNRKITALIAVFFSLLSAAYVQSYIYYSFGQISSLPIFIAFCIYLKQFLDEAQNKIPNQNIWGYSLLLAIILNSLFFMYAILSVFAGVLAVISYGLVILLNRQKTSLLPLLKMLFLALIIFSVARIFIIPESIVIFKSWIMLSNSVALERGHETFIVFSEYLTEKLPALMLGLANYPTTSSLVYKWSPSIEFQINFLISAGIVALSTTILIFLSFLRTAKYNLSSRVILFSLLLVFILFSAYFFCTLSGYGLFKIQTWFFPILLVMYVYYLLDYKISLLNLVVKCLCALIIVMNLLTSYFYIRDYFVSSDRQKFINAKNITGNKDIYALTEKIKSLPIKQVSLMLSNGFDVAWISDQLRTFNLTHVIHNAQTLNDKDLAKKPCSDENNEAINLLGLIVMMNSSQPEYNEITPPPQGGTIAYQNKSFTLLDSNTLKTFSYIGSGAYPTEVLHKKKGDFPSKFRWIEKGVEIYIYSDKDKAIDFTVDITPGYVTTRSAIRHINIATKSEQKHFQFTNPTVLSMPNLRLHKGLNCLVISSPDPVEAAPRYYASIREKISLDPRLLNFAVSQISIREKTE